MRALKEILQEHPFLKYSLIVCSAYLTISLGYILGKFLLNL